MRILYVEASSVPPPKHLQSDRFFLLSQKLEGDVLQPVWFSTPEEVEAAFGPGSFPVYQSGRFRYHWFLTMRYRGILRRLATYWFYLRKGMQLHRERKYDCIIAYSHMTTGLLAGILKFLQGSKLIVEVVIEPESVYLTMRPKPTILERIMHFYSDVCLHLSILISDRLHLLYPGQVDRYVGFRRALTSVFPDFVPVSMIDRDPPPDNAEPYVLLVGAPWYRKGVDRLIEAFRRLSTDFPKVKLKILGHFPDRDTLDALTDGSPQIEILRARPNPEVLPIVRAATIMALPSRCEGVPRVLIEGMAAGVPLVASDAGGISYIIANGENGYVVANGDAHVLEERLRELLSDPEKCRRMGNNGYDRAHSELSEQTYIEKFSKMVEVAVDEE